MLQVIRNLRTKSNKLVAIDNALRIRENPSSIGTNPLVVFRQYTVLAEIHQFSVDFLKTGAHSTIMIQVIRDMRTKGNQLVTIENPFGIREIIVSFKRNPSVVLTKRSGLVVQIEFPVLFLHAARIRRLRSRTPIGGFTVRGAFFFDRGFFCRGCFLFRRAFLFVRLLI